jgi:hypothetical protein
LRRSLRRARPGIRMAAVPAMMAFIDGAKMWGYVRGMARRAGGSKRTGPP